MIEFFTTPDKNRLMVHDIDNDTIEPFDTNHMALAKEIENKVKTFYPDTYNSLCKLYGSQPAMVMGRVSRFLRCNFSIYNNKPDIDSNGYFNLEIVPCPLRGECKDGICNPKMAVDLSDRELSIIRLYVEGYSHAEVAEKLFLASSTVHNHLTNIYRKLGFTGQPNPDHLLINYAFKNRLV